MVKPNNVDTIESNNLDDIISKMKKTKSSIQKNPFGGARPGNRRPTGIPRRSGGSGWKDLDDFANHGIVSRGSDNKVVRINITNLASTVVSSDLEELFGDFNIHSVHVNFNEHGDSLGTGDISVSKRDAERLVQKFAGVALDGRVCSWDPTSR